jgi:nicotinate dehydrogenase subunit B
VTAAMASPPSRRLLLKRSGILAVVSPPNGTVAGDATHEDALDIYVCVTAEGRIVAFCGHVDLGTGVRTALAQIIAEELDFPIAAVELVLGDTAETPNQGPTIASETVQVTAHPLRIATAQARQHLLILAADALQCVAADLIIADGCIRRRGDTTPAIALDTLLDNRRILLPLAADTALKPVDQHHIVGKPVGRVDIPAKVTGQFVYVHDVRVPGMLHGRMVRPPYAGIDSGEFIGRSLESVDRASLDGIPGIRAVVVEGDFVGIVAEREEHAVEAALKLNVRWKAWRTSSDLGDISNALRAQPAKERRLIDQGDVDAALKSAASRLNCSYVWPYQMHASIGPSCAVADVTDAGITVWSGTQNPHVLQSDIAALTGIPLERIDIIRLEAAGCYGRNCADDVSADAVLLSRAVGVPVRVQLSREQEHLWEPKGAAQIIDVCGALGPNGVLAAYDFRTRYPSNAAPTLALLLTGRLSPQPMTQQMGDRSAVPSYDYENMRITAYDMPPIVRAAWLRGVSALPNVFAHESFIDELAYQAGEDPVAFRLRHLKDTRAAELVKATAARAGWQSRIGPAAHDQENEIVRGRGFAQARYVHGNWPGVGAAWSAWVADVAVNRTTGEVTVTRVVVGQDTGMMINPAGVRHQIHGNVVQSTSRVLKEEVTFSETTAVASREWGSYPILTFPELPAIDVLLMDRQHEAPLGAGESASVPSAAAIVNAVYDATGVRFRELPLTPERVLAGLRRQSPAPRQTAAAKRWALRASLGSLFAGLATFTTIALPIKPAIAPIERPDPTTYSSATIEKGRRLAALGGCAICHTAKDGLIYAGGRLLQTPFGVVVTTNITPDPTTGIGNWSFPAFERAMREGIHRDGRHLYPAFPYPDFASVSEADLQALYAFLMTQPAVAQANISSRLTFPFNIRPLLAAWNFLFNRRSEIRPDPARSMQWNRGRYLVDGLGHCGACHSPRNALGAERAGSAYLAGGTAEGWDAPALTKVSLAPLPWSEEELFAYLRTGTTAHHGTASGPMAEVIEELKQLPDDDIRAVANYLASLNEAPPDAKAEEIAQRIISSTAASTSGSAAARLYEGACAVCHESGATLINRGPALGLSSKLAAASPTNFLRLLLEGGGHVSGSMPGFAASLDDRQILGLAGYLRGRFAPQQPQWRNVDQILNTIRASAAQ